MGNRYLKIVRTLLGCLLVSLLLSSSGTLAFNFEVEMEVNSDGRPKTSCGPACSMPDHQEKQGSSASKEVDTKVTHVGTITIRPKPEPTKNGPPPPKAKPKCISRRCAEHEGASQSEAQGYPSANPGFYSETTQTTYENLKEVEEAIESSTIENANRAKAVNKKTEALEGDAAKRLKAAVAVHNKLARKVKSIPLPDPGPGNDDETDDPKEVPNPHKTPTNSPYWQKIDDSRGYAAYAREELEGRDDPDMDLRLKGLDAADFANAAADEAYASNQTQTGDGFVSAAKQIVDAALSFAPVAGNLIAAYEAVYGVNPITGDTISPAFRAISFGSVFLPFAGKGLKTAAKVLGRMKKSAIAKRVMAMIGMADSTLAKQGVPGDLGKVGDVTDKFRGRVQEVFGDDKAYKHVMEGDLGRVGIDKVNGPVGLKSGMHTKKGFDRFKSMAQKTGGSISQKAVRKFDSVNTDSRSIKTQELDNGVTRLQLSKDLWVNRNAHTDAIAYTETGKKIIGAKTLFPENWSQNKVLGSIEKVVSKSQSGQQKIEGVVDGVNILVKMDKNGKVITAYPKWVQK